MDKSEFLDVNNIDNYLRKERNKLSKQLKKYSKQLKDLSLQGWKRKNLQDEFEEAIRNKKTIQDVRNKKTIQDKEFKCFKAHLYASPGYCLEGVVLIKRSKNIREAFIRMFQEITKSDYYVKFRDQLISKITIHNENELIISTYYGTE